MKTGINKWLSDINQSFDHYLKTSPFKFEVKWLKNQVKTLVWYNDNLVAQITRHEDLKEVLAEENTQEIALISIESIMPMVQKLFDDNFKDTLNHLWNVLNLKEEIKDQFLQIITDLCQLKAGSVLAKTISQTFANATDIDYPRNFEND